VCLASLNGNGPPWRTLLAIKVSQPQPRVNKCVSICIEQHARSFSFSPLSSEAASGHQQASRRDTDRRLHTEHPLRPARHACPCVARPYVVSSFSNLDYRQIRSRACGMNDKSIKLRVTITPTWFRVPTSPRVQWQHVYCVICPRRRHVCRKK